ncbi:MAG: hypothetical protein ABEJ82_01020 [Haloplanus sp.]
MDRRAVLRRLGLTVALGAGCSDLPHATGPRTPPPPGDPSSGSGGSASNPVSVTDLGVGKDDGGALQVDVAVTNRAASEQTRTLRVWVVVDDRRSERSLSVTVPAGETTETTVTFEDVTYDEFSGSGTVNARIQ